MKCTLAEMRNKEIINITNGARLGYVDDVVFDTETAAIKSFIVYGRTRLFGLLGREDDLIITCKDIEIIGVDTVLVSVNVTELTKRSGYNAENLSK